MYNDCKNFLEEFQQSNTKFIFLNKKDICIRLKQILSPRFLPRQQEENIKYKTIKYTTLLNFDQFYKWDSMDYLIYNTLNEKFPVNTYGHIVRFLLNSYDPDIQYVNINQCYLKQECDEKIKEGIKKEYVKLKKEFNEYRHKMNHRFRRMEIMYKVKRRQDIKKIHNEFYNIITKIKEEQKIFQEQIQTKNNGIKNNKFNESNAAMSTTITTKIEHCTLNHCLFINDNNKTKKRKYDNEDIKENKLSTLIDEILQKIINILKDESLREKLNECLERRPNHWEYGGFVCTVNNNNNTNRYEHIDSDQKEKKEYKKCIFLKKGNDKWMELLRIIGCNDLMEKEMDPNPLKQQIVSGSKRVRLNGVQNKNTVNKRQYVLLSSI